MSSQHCAPKKYHCKKVDLREHEWKDAECYEENQYYIDQKFLVVEEKYLIEEKKYDAKKCHQKKPKCHPKKYDY